MTPNIYCFIVEHEERFPDLSHAVEVYPIATLNVFVVNQMRGRLLDVTDKSLNLLLAKLANFLKFLHVEMFRRK